MESLSWGPAATRRDFIKYSTLIASGLALPIGLARVAEAIAAGQLKDVPRNRTLVTVRDGGTDGKFTEHELGALRHRLQSSAWGQHHLRAARLL